MTAKDNSSFTFTDDEIELLLQVCLDFKSANEYGGVDWESVRNKYEKIREKFMERYPKNSDSVMYPNSNELEEKFTIKRISAKLKSIRTGYKKAVDAKRRSGGGRVVLTFYDICENIWGGSPSVTNIKSGIDSSLVIENEGLDIDNFTGDSPTEVKDGENDTETDGEYHDNLVETSTGSKRPRRESISTLLKEHKTRKLCTRISPDTQMLQCFKEDLALKRKLADKLEKTDEDLTQCLTNVNKTMETIGSAMTQTVQLLGELVRSPHGGQFYNQAESNFNFFQQRSPSLYQVPSISPNQPVIPNMRSYEHNYQKET